MNQKLVRALVFAGALAPLGCDSPELDLVETASQELRMINSEVNGTTDTAIAVRPTPITTTTTTPITSTATAASELQRAHPWAVHISGTGGLSCRGVLIHPRWVLTAGHCIGPYAGQVSYSRTDPATGVVTTASRSFDVTGPKRGMFLHPEYVFDSGFGQPLHDIALIKLATPFDINADVQTAALPRFPSNPGRTGAIVTANHAGPPPTGYATVVKAPTLGPTQCTTPSGFLCISPPANSMCEGDSGSGYVQTLYGRATAVGVASNISGGGGCNAAGAHAQLTDVHAHLGWILQTMAMSKEQVAGQVRLRRSGWSSTGTMSLLCMKPGSPLVSVPMNVPGGEIGVDCDGGYATRVFCHPQGADLRLAGFSVRNIAADGSASAAQTLPFLSSFTVYLADPSPSFQEFTCNVGHNIIAPQPEVLSNAL
jgi:hypothetical protein